MKCALDTNVLIYAHIPSMPDHNIVRACLLECLRNTSQQLVVTPVVLHEFVHVITDAR